MQEATIKSYYFIPNQTIKNNPCFLEEAYFQLEMEWVLELNKTLFQ